MKEEINPALGLAITETVETQLESQNPPETRETFDRLISLGCSEEESKRLIGCALTAEMYEVLKKHEPYNHERYVGYLNKLPKLPWE